MVGKFYHAATPVIEFRTGLVPDTVSGQDYGTGLDNEGVLTDDIAVMGDGIPVYGTAMGTR